MKDAISLITLIILYIPAAYITLYAYKNSKLIYRIIYIAVSAALVYYTNYLFLAANIILLFALYKKDIIPSDTDKLTKKLSINDIVVLTAGVLGIKIIFALINIVYVIILKKFNIPIQSQEIVQQLSASSAGSFIYLSVLIVIFAPIAEEFCFRYFIYDKTLSGYLKLNKYLSAVISAAIFSALHANIAGAPTFFMLGIVLCYVYEKKGFWASVCVHAGYNAFSIISILFYSKLGGF
jgi:membrane protease YdiL (CAAX protease family)